jgi:hypothetical protein
MKLATAIVLFAVLASISLTQPTYAQSMQVSTANLTYLNVQATYPSEVLPANSVSVHVQATAKSSIELLSLTAQIYYADGASLRQLTTSTIASNVYMSNGYQVSKDIQVTVPQDAPRTSLIAQFSEKVQSNYYNYYYSPYIYYYGYNDSYPYYRYYYHSYPYYYYGAYSAYSYSTATDGGVAPLSYIKATTPEYITLQTEYQMLQQQLAQSQDQNQQLQQNLQNAQNTITQQNAAIANLNQQLSSAETMVGTLQVVSIALAGLAIALGVVTVCLARGKSRNKQQKSTKSNQ